MIADIIAEDAQGRVVLVGEIKSGFMEERLVGKFLEYLSENVPEAEFLMIVDRRSIRVWSCADRDPERPLISLNTSETLRPYEPKIDDKKIGHFYLGGLIRAWLVDAIDHWKFKNPSGARELSDIRLLPRLTGGVVRDEVTLDRDLVR
ncbi:MAG: hypothetical protein NVSMB14_03460 [Isosphaeraceae bacterium]